jgi:predicted kinase
MLATATRPMKRINNDELRAMIDGGKWSKSNESLIRLVREKMLDEFLGRNYDVIIDNLNLRPEDEERYRQVAATHRAQFEIIDMTDVPLHTCIARDRLRSKPVGEKVIWGWYRDFIEPKERKRWLEPVTLPRAIGSDLDGTLAYGIGIHRKPFDWDRVGLDEVVIPVQTVLKNWKLANPQGTIIFVSGRDGCSYEATVNWLINKAGFEEFELFMRLPGDSRPDHVVKRELFEKYIEPSYHLEFMLDDRPSVIRNCWEPLGVFCLNVGKGIDF